MNTTPYHKEFVAKLEQLYGTFNPVTNKFESTSNSIIARDLCYSDSQFSRLINNTASEGEFKRTLRNVDRYLNETRLQKQEESKENESPTPFRKWGLPVMMVVLLGFLAYLGYQMLPEEDHNAIVEEPTRYEMLKWSFENNYIKPYVQLNELPEDCDYPCYKYQGRWVLKNEYKVPIFRERNGFHYVAKEAVVYAKCMDDRNRAGNLLEGYEYQKHEIWYDKRERPIDSFLRKNNKTEIRESYNTSDFSTDENFVKMAYVHTFFRNEFNIDSSLVYRTGQVIGRDIEFLPIDVLGDDLDSKDLIDELKIEVNAIAKNRLEDFSKPIDCSPADVPDVNFNNIEHEDELGFECQFSTGRFLVDYRKVFVLDNQYINNNCR